MTKYTLATALCLALAMPMTLLAKDEVTVDSENGRPIVQIAILLDNSGSMSGLINQARSEMWRMVNEFIGATIDGQRPQLEVAVYHYGNPPATRLTELTDDLDAVSDALFKIPVNGGSEYCGAVIKTAVKELKWSSSPNDLKLIFIAGNEPFSQGPVNYRDACKLAIENGIIINTIHCGDGIPTDWRDGALLADGTPMNINHTKAVPFIEAPQDKEIAALGVKLNETYIAYGKAGKDGAVLQMQQDTNAANLSLNAAQQRAVAKANGYYRNSKWDLCDAIREKKLDLDKVDVKLLPENMQKMSVEERKKYVESKQTERSTIQKQINELNEKRNDFVAKKRKELAEKSGEKTLDQVFVETIRAQAAKKNYVFEK